MVNRTLFYEELNKLQNKKTNIIQSALDGRMSAIEAATNRRNAVRTQTGGSDPIPSFIRDSRSSAPNNDENTNGYTLDTDSMRTSLEHVKAVREAAEEAERLRKEAERLQAQSVRKQTTYVENTEQTIDGIIITPSQRKAAASAAMSKYNEQAQAAAYIMSETSKYPSMHAEYEKAAADYKKATAQYELAQKEYNKAVKDEKAYKESDAYKEEQRLAQTPIENATTVDELKHNLNIYQSQTEALQLQLNSNYLIYDVDMYEEASQAYKTSSALQTQTQQAYNAAVDKEIEAHREEYLAQGYHAANFWDNTALSVLRGYYESKYYKEMALEALGFENQSDYWAEKLEDDKFKFFSDNYADQAVSGASGVVGQMGAEVLSYETFFTTVAAVGFALAAGNAGPGALLPEEVFTIPAALAYGINSGMAVTGAQIEMGMAYVEMIEAGVDRDTAVLISIGVGFANGILESIQIGDLITGFKVLDAAGVDNTFTKQLTRYLVDQGQHIVAETAEEVVQEMVTIAGVNAGKAASGLETDSLSDIGQRLKDTAVSSALTFGVLNVAGLSGRLANKAITRESLGNLSAQESHAVNKAVTAKYAEQLKQEGVSQEHIDTYVKQSEKNATSKEAADTHTASVVDEMNTLNDQKTRVAQTSAVSDFNVQQRVVLTDSDITTKLETKTAFTETELKSMDTAQLQSIVKSLSDDFAKSWKAAGLDPVTVDKKVSEMTRQTDTAELVKSTQIMQDELGFGEGATLLEDVGDDGLNIDDEHDKIDTSELYRKDKNTGRFAQFEIPMQKRYVVRIAKKYGVDISGLKISIQRDIYLVNIDICGSTNTNNLNRVDLYPRAFLNEEQLIRTLLHEKCHLAQYVKYGERYVENHISDMENEARSYENEMYDKIIKGFNND